MGQVATADAEVLMLDTFRHLAEVSNYLVGMRAQPAPGRAVRSEVGDELGVPPVRDFSLGQRVERFRRHHHVRELNASWGDLLGARAQGLWYKFVRDCDAIST